MLCANDLRRRSVVDLDAAEKVGEVADVIVDLDARRVVGFVIALASTFIGSRHALFLPARAVHAIGPDAVTTRRYQPTAEEAAELAAAPRLTQLLGRRLITHSGSLLGALADLLIVPTTGQLAGLAFEPPNGAGSLGGLFHPAQPRRRDYVRAEADLRLGQALLIVPDDAVVRNHDLAHDSPDRLVAPSSRIRRAVGPHRAGRALPGCLGSPPAKRAISRRRNQRIR